MKITGQSKKEKEFMEKIAEKNRNRFAMKNKDINNSKMEK